MKDWRNGKFTREHTSERLLFFFVAFSRDYWERDDIYMQFLHSYLVT